MTLILTGSVFSNRQTGGLIGAGVSYLSADDTKCRLEFVSMLAILNTGYDFWCP